MLLQTDSTTIPAAARIDYPMLFEIHSPNSGRTSHCGVMEFVAEEGQVYIPNWVRTHSCFEKSASESNVSFCVCARVNDPRLTPIFILHSTPPNHVHLIYATMAIIKMMENLALSENDIVRLRSCSLPKAKFVKLQPETKDFLDITNPKAV